MDVNYIAILVAVLGAGGVGAAIREIVSVITLTRNGMSGKEDARRADIIQQRDDAIARMKIAEKDADDADDRADAEANRRRQWQEQSARYRLQLIALGADVGQFPDIDETTTPTR